MANDLLARVGSFLGARRPWYELPAPAGDAALMKIRNELREKNLHDTEEPPLRTQGDSSQPFRSLREERTVDGTYNDLNYPAMGSCGRRFGRNVPLEHVFPDTANLLNPNPRVVSRELMTRHEFQPASFLNLLAASWIQFMVHDWFVHKRSSVDDGIEIPLAPGDDWADQTMKVPRSVPDPAPAGSTRPPAYANPNSHWWDGSQIYGSDTRPLRELRTGDGGKLKTRTDEAVAGRSSRPDSTSAGSPTTGGSGSRCFIRCSRSNTTTSATCSPREHPDWTDEQFYGKAQADQLRDDGQDSYGRMDACDPAASGDRDRDEHQLVWTGSARSCRKFSSSSTTTRFSAASSGPMPITIPRPIR